MQKEKIDLDFDYAEFQIIKEPWNLYRLEDGALLKLKLVLIKVVREKQTDDKGNPILSFNHQNIVGVLSPPELRGQPSPEGKQPQIKQKDINFKPEKDEEWNEYQLEDGTVLKGKNVIVMVNKTDKFDSHGEPIYTVETQTIFKIIPKFNQVSVKKH